MGLGYMMEYFYESMSACGFCAGDMTPPYKTLASAYVLDGFM